MLANCPDEPHVLVLVPGLNLLDGCCSGRAAPSWAAEAGPAPATSPTQRQPILGTQVVSLISTHI